MKVRSLPPAFGWLVVLLVASPAAAQTIIVPDDAPTIQAAINSGAREVLVRRGYYFETPLIERAMTIRGLLEPGSDELPVMNGLTLDDTYHNSSHSARLTISNLHFLEPVKYVFHLANFSGPYTLEFTNCTMNGGIANLATVNGQVFWHIFGCRISGGLRVSGEGVQVRDNVIQGPVQASGYYTWIIERNVIDGPGAIGIWYSYADEPRPVILNNTVRGFTIGIRGDYPKGSEVTGNLVEDCTTAGIDIDETSDGFHNVMGNTVRRCGSAITLDSRTDYSLVRFFENVVEDCGTGIRSTTGSFSTRGNRVSSCGNGNGLDLKALYQYEPSTSLRDTVMSCPGGLRLVGSSSVAVDSAFVLSCGGPGIAIEAPSASASHCVVGRSQAEGILLSASLQASLSSNTSFLNGGSGMLVKGPGSVSGPISGNIGHGNQGYGFEADPGMALALGCNDWFGNSSGATSGVPPGTTDLAVNPFFCNLPSNDVHLAPFSPLLSAEGCGLIGALGAGCPGGPVGRDDASPLGFAIARVGPVPSTGRVRIELTLPRAASIELTVHDVQGRSVARLASGEWTAGPHVIDWNGHGSRGRHSPGVYLVRYRFPGGQDSRRIVISP